MKYLRHHEEKKYLQIDVSKRASKTELEKLENSYYVPIADIQTQISMIEGRINSTNDNVEIQSDNINELKVRHLLFFYSLLYIKSHILFTPLQIDIQTMFSNTEMETMKIGLQNQLDNKVSKEDLQVVKVSPLQNHDNIK